MDFQKKAKELEGIYTVKLLSKKLHIKERTAVNYIYELRKKGFVKTERGKGKKRLYTISPYIERKGGLGFYETINKYSPIKIARPYKHVIHGKELKIEEVIIKGIKTGDYRIIIAVLPLFRKIKNWSLLYKLAKKENIRNAVGALYDLAKLFVKVKKMDERTRKALKKDKKRRYIIKGVKSDHFKEIEKEWNIYIPFTRGDLLRLK